MIAPRVLIVEAARGPEATIPGGRGAPGRVVTPELASVRSELDRAKKLVSGFQPPPQFELIVSGNDGRGACGSERALSAFLKPLAANVQLSTSADMPQIVSPLPDATARHARQLHELDRHSQWLLRESQYVRNDKFWGKLNYESLEKYTESVEP